jgi:hypothetical protein
MSNALYYCPVRKFNLTAIAYTSVSLASQLQRVVFLMRKIFRKIAASGTTYCTREAQGMTTRKLECLTCGAYFVQGRSFNQHVSLCCAIAHARTETNNNVSSSERSASDATDGEQNALNGPSLFLFFTVSLQNSILTFYYCPDKTLTPQRDHPVTELTVKKTL